MVSRDFKGFTLVEIVIAIGLMSLGALAITQLMQGNLTQAVFMRATATRDALVNQTRNYANNAKALGNSLGHASNTMLANCVNGSTPNACIAIQGGNPAKHPLTLLMAIGSEEVSGPSTESPKRFTKDGVACTTASDACPFEVITTFTPSCPSAAASCTTAVQIRTEHTVRVAPSVASASKQLALLGTKTGFVDMDTSRINSGGAQICPAGQIMNGIQADGSLSCVMPPPGTHGPQGAQGPAGSASNIPCNWNGGRWVSHGRNNDCAWSTGIYIYCDGTNVTQVTWSEARGCVKKE